MKQMIPKWIIKNLFYGSLVVWSFGIACQANVKTQFKLRRDQNMPSLNLTS